ncbi:GNAT family N-acetyltransferase [Neptunicella marina]|uniref:GNAT family N-acetyltransferase n=1 Tax=Neptunicella marina TaxID=2125989 RepID=A0A8J6J0V0_9ALTE|nr:GNAT family N-acetyltransferase [Neptunicella marina]MBC3767672.1 GNAT family N-acetyltransferase [Neptunicella marina]
MQSMIGQLENAGYRLSMEKDELQFDVIHGFLKDAYWCKNIPFEVVQRAAQNALTFAIFQHDKQVAYCRIVSDFAIFAHLADVFVLDEHRGKGLSKWLVHAVKQHPQLQGLRKWTLATSDAHELYRQFGFSEPTSPHTLMEISNNQIYMA